MPIHEREYVDLFWAPGFCWCGCKRRVQRPWDRFVADHKDTFIDMLVNSKPMKMFRVKISTNQDIAIGSPGMVAGWALSLDDFVKFDARRRGVSEERAREKIDRQIFLDSEYASLLKGE